MTYYAQRKSIKDGAPITPNNRYGTREEMERQFHLYCASACIHTDQYEVDAIEWGTIEQGAIERKKYTYTPPAPEPEPEPEEPVESEEPEEPEEPVGE